MCLAVPAKLISIDSESNMGTVLHFGNEMKVSTRLVSPKVGDYLLIHAGCAIEIVDREPAEEILDIYELLEELAHES